MTLTGAPEAAAGRDELRLYLDGDRAAVRPVSAVDPGTGRWWLGGGLSAVLDDVAVFHQALTPDEVDARHPRPR